MNNSYRASTPTDMRPDIDAAISFLEWYRPGGFWVSTSISPGGGPTLTMSFKDEDEATLRRWLGNQIEDGRNVYFHVNRTMRMLDSKAEKADMASMDWFHVDVDPDPGEDLRSEQKRILAMLQAHESLPRPSLIVFSGGGYQAFWRLAKPIEINGDVKAAEDAERYNIQIQTMFRADSCHDVSRIMRLPGTINFPNEKKRKRGQEPVQAFIVSQTDDVYDLTQFIQAPLVQDGSTSTSDWEGAVPVKLSGNRARIQDVEDLGPNVSDRVKAVIVQGRDTETPLKGRDQSRSAWLFYVICELVRAGIEDDVIFSVITDPDFIISESILQNRSAAAAEREATRQIRRGKERAKSPLLQQINDDYAFIESVGGKCRIVKQSYNPGLRREETDFLGLDGFRAMWGNRFVEVKQPPKADGGVREPKMIQAGHWWLMNKHRRTYSRVIFAPNEEHPDCLNLWRGFACDAIPGDCSKYLDHLKTILCRGNEEYYQYLIRWMAFAVQYPGRVPEVAVVLRGRQGAGKGTFANHFGSLFGCHYRHITNPDHVVGKFNATLETAVLLFADEAFVAGSKGHNSNLKTLISEMRLSIEKKGIDMFEGRNCVHLIMASNEDWVVPVDADDRRFFILDVSDDQRCDTNYFGAIADEMDNGGREALLHYLLNYDLTGVNIRHRPQTQELHRQQMRSLNAQQRWWLQKLEDGKLVPSDGDWTGEAINDSLADGFAEGDKDLSPRGVSMLMAGFLRGVLPGDWPVKFQMSGKVSFHDARGAEQKRVRPMASRFPPLAECRAYWEELFGPHDWPAIETSEPEMVEEVDDDTPF